MILCGSHVNLWHHRHVTSPAAIDELLKHGEDVKLILTEQVVQVYPYIKVTGSVPVCVFRMISLIAEPM